jgi:hypothetical protein
MSIRGTVVAAAVALLVFVASAAADSGGGAITWRDTYHTTLQEELTNPCTGEPFTSTGTYTDTFSGTQTPSGMNNVTDHELATYTGVSPSGATYVGTSVVYLHQTGPDPGSTVGDPNEVTVYGNPTIHWIRTGEDGTTDDFYMHDNVVVILNLETQTYQMYRVHESTECK